MSYYNINKIMNTPSIHISYIHGIFLILLSIVANFLAPTLSCRVQRVLTSSQWMKYIVVLCLIYFTVNFTNGDNNESPFIMLGQSFLILIAFILFNRMEFFAIVIVFLSLTLIMFVDNWISYKKDKTKKIEKKNINTLDIKQKHHNSYILLMENIKKILTIVIGIVMIIGVGTYLIRQRREHSKDFSYITFFLGNPNCDYLL